MGCAECKLLKLLLKEESVRELVGVDIQASLLKANSHHLQPLITDFIIRRSSPLTVKLFQGIPFHLILSLTPFIMSYLLHRVNSRGWYQAHGLRPPHMCRSVCPTHTVSHQTNSLLQYIHSIEHLDAPVLELVPTTVFGEMQPKIAIFTTPNSEFNVLFPNFHGFRHPDHRFEWTRLQFQEWLVSQWIWDSSWMWLLGVKLYVRDFHSIQ